MYTAALKTMNEAQLKIAFNEYNEFKNSFIDKLFHSFDEFQEKEKSICDFLKKEELERLYIKELKKIIPLNKWFSNLLMNFDSLIQFFNFFECIDNDEIFLKK